MPIQSPELKPLMNTLCSENSDFLAYEGSRCCRRYGVGAFVGFQSNLLELETKLDSQSYAQLELEVPGIGVSKLFYLPASILDKLSGIKNMDTDAFRFLQTHSRRYVAPQQMVVMVEMQPQNWMLTKYMPY